MNENINLVEILKNCPKGTKLYSPIYGEVEFQEICASCYPIIVLAYYSYNEAHNLVSEIRSFTSDGKYSEGYKDDECILFPSKEQRDWTKFKCPKSKFDPKTLKQFDRVIGRTADDRVWIAFLLHPNINSISLESIWKQIIPYNEETKHLVGTKEEAPKYYRYWED